MNTQVVTTKKCDGNLPQSHEGKIFGICQKCGENVCPKCSTIKHMDHLESLFAYDMECANLANLLTQIKSNTRMALTTNNKLMPKKEISVHTQQIQTQIQLAYQDFLKEILKYRDLSLKKIRGSRFVKNLRTQLTILTGSRIAKMNEMRENTKSKIEALCKASTNEKYQSCLEIAFASQEYKTEVEALIESRQKEAEAYLSKLRRFKEIYIETDKSFLKPICEISKLHQLDAEIFKISREAELIVAYRVTTKKLMAIRFSNYEPLFNSVLVEINRKAYVIGGSVTDDLPSEEESYANWCVVIDMDTGFLDRTADMKDRRTLFGATYHDDCIFVVGGHNYKGSLKECEVYSCITGEWNQISPLNSKKEGCAICMFGKNALYCFGGAEKMEDSEAFEKLEFPERQESKWEKIILPENIIKQKDWQHSGMIQIGDEEILIFGGITGKNNIANSLIYNAVTKKLEDTSELKESDKFIGSQPVKFADSIYVFGDVRNNLHVFNIKTREWSLFKDIIQDALSLPQAN